jgi:hypothetical protein
VSSPRLEAWSRSAAGISWLADEAVTKGVPITEPLSREARNLRRLHSLIGAGELLCLVYLWICALTRRRDRWLHLSVTVLVGEGSALVVHGGCPFGVFQQRAGDDVPMFELWFGPRLAPFAIPMFTAITLSGFAVLFTRRPLPSST